MRISHQQRDGRSPFRRSVLVVVSLAVAVLGGLFTQSSASATTATTGKTQVVRATIDVPALILENKCNLDTVNLHGQETITTATTPTSNGGFRIVSSAQAHNLTGQRIAPLPAYGYKGDDTENTYSYLAAPPYPSTVSVLHWTKLVPQAKAPAMWLVLVTREVITADGTAIPTVDRAYLTCTQPSSHDCHRVS